MENHRNIPILNVQSTSISQESSKGKLLIDLLNGNKDIQRVSYDYQQNRYHVSTHATKYRAVHQWITTTLAEQKFPYAPHIRPLKYGNRTGNTTNFGTVLSTAMSANPEDDASTIKTHRSISWKQRPPLNISYVLDAEAFPPLPKNPTQIPTTPSTTSETLDEDTIQSAISAVIEAKHRAELENLKKEMQQKMTAIENQMKELAKQVAVQTYQALVNDDSPLVTKTDQEHMKHDIQALSQQMATLIQMFQSSQAPKENVGPTSPPRTIKRPKPNSTPEHQPNKSYDIYSQDTHGTSATSNLDEELEGCEE